MLEASDKKGRIIDESWNAFISKMNAKHNIKNILFWFKRLEATGFIREIVSSSEFVCGGGRHLYLGIKVKAMKQMIAYMSFMSLF